MKEIHDFLAANLENWMLYSFMAMVFFGCLQRWYEESKYYSIGLDLWLLFLCIVSGLSLIFCPLFLFLFRFLSSFS